MSSWFEERRADKVADAQQRREDRAFESELRRKEAREAKKERREDEAQQRRDRAARRQARAARREKTFTPGNVYRKGTLALVAASALASLPAQVAHFVKISVMLLPLPFALEGAAWVMAAGVAYADERKLPAWVRWLLRALSMGAAGYAASINYTYGAETNASVAWGLAGVTVMGPAVFEIRQWVSTLSASVVDPKKRAEEKARARHEKRRRKDHGDVVGLAKQLVSAAPYGTLSFENAFAAAWEIKYGTRTPGMTPALHGEKLASSKAYAAAMDAANGSPVSTRGRLLELLHPAPVQRFETPKKSQVVSDLSPSVNKAPEKASKGPRKPPPPHRRTKGDSVPFGDVAKKQHSHEARTRLAVNGHHH
ncbi:hypothetical protein [Streptomyces rishiriensis]|uniref:hypothetical protein n=1 Tax=Streptomyces rishiriensis TaxID=68264 RepID=UPI000D594B55|nr:hypothetical protein [Streptomyces rishiriensis]